MPKDLKSATFKISCSSCSSTIGMLQRGTCILEDKPVCTLMQQLHSSGIPPFFLLSLCKHTQSAFIAPTTLRDKLVTMTAGNFTPRRIVFGLVSIFDARKTATSSGSTLASLVHSQSWRADRSDGSVSIWRENFGGHTPGAVSGQYTAWSGCARLGRNSRAELILRPAGARRRPKRPRMTDDRGADFRRTTGLMTTGSSPP